MSACNGKAPVSVSNEEKLITWRPALFEHQLHPPFRLVIGRTHQLKTDKPTANVLWPRCAFQRSKDIKFTEKCCWRHQHNLWTKSKKQKINQNFKQINRNAAAFKTNRPSYIICHWKMLWKSALIWHTRLRKLMCYYSNNVDERFSAG